MGDKRILIADPNQAAWEEFRQTLGESWTVVGVGDGRAALAEADKRPFDAIVAVYDLPELDGAELLNQLRIANPKTLRFIAAAESQREKVVCHVLGGHQFLPIPYNRAITKTVIERSVAESYGMSQSMRELVGRIRTFPSIPSLYLDVVSALNDPNATTEDIGNIIAKDMAMTTKLVQVLNSAYFGLPRTITDPTEAVGILGFETVKSLIMTVKMLNQYDKVKPVYFSIDSIWKHSTNVAQTAKALAMLETGDTQISGHAYTAGLMHDLGKVILAANFDDQYHGAHTIARKQRVPLWEVEKEIFGASHGEIGAYLLGLWGISPDVTQIAANHHHPARSSDDRFTALTAVHVANALEYEGVPLTADDLPVPEVDLAYLQQIGMEDRLEAWREGHRNPESLAFETRMLHAKATAAPTAKKAAPAPVPARNVHKFAPPEEAEKARVLQSVSRWVAIGMGVCAAAGGFAWFEIARLKATTPKSEEVAEQIPSALRHAAPADIPPAKVAEVKGPEPAPQPAPAPAAVVPVETPKPAPVKAPEKTALDRIKVQAIFYSAKHPSALISGQTASINDVVGGCRVLDISPSAVTLEYQNQRKTFNLP